MSEVVRFAVLSDEHVAAATRQPLMGIDSRDKFEAAVERLRSLHPPPAFVIHLGDLANDGTAEAYAEFVRIASRIEQPQFPVRGNHDEPELLDAALPVPALGEPAGAPLGYYGFNWGPVHFVALDSRAPGQGMGRLDTAQLAWLEADLEQHRDLRTVVLLHHPPTAIGIDWLDAVALENGPELLALLARAGNVAAVFVGHVHRRESVAVGALAVETVPSTWACFGPERGLPIDAGQGFLVVEAGLDALSIERVLV